MLIQMKAGYNHNDGFIDTQIFDLGNDGDWVYFLTNQGVIFYNWRGIIIKRILIISFIFFITCSTT